MTGALLDLVVARLRAIAEAGDPLSVELGLWLGVLRDAPTSGSPPGSLWSPREAALAGVREAHGGTPPRPFSEGLAALRKREFFAPHSPGVFEADPLAIFAVAIGIAATGDREACAWIGDFAARAAVDESEDWRLGLLSAAQVVAGRTPLQPMPPDLAAALTGRGIGRVDDALAASAMEVCLSLDDLPPERAVVRLAAIQALGAKVAREARAPIPGAEASVVFVSYTHDSPDHRAQVLGLAQRLRADGLDCRIDRFVAGSPPEGWPLWMERQVAAARHVLVVCTSIYLRRYEGREEKGKGLGATWEAVLTRQELYEGAGVNTKFIPVLFEGATLDDIPRPLRPFTRYKLMDTFDDLYRVLTDQPEVKAAPIGARKVLPTG